MSCESHFKRRYTIKYYINRVRWLTYGIPNTGQPVRHQHIKAQQQYQHRSSVFQVPIQFSNDPAQS